MAKKQSRYGEVWPLAVALLATSALAVAIGTGLSTQPAKAADEPQSAAPASPNSAPQAAKLRSTARHVAVTNRPPGPPEDLDTPGALTLIDPYGKYHGAKCPLKHTGVQAEISGFVARVNVTQQFENTYKDPIEAIYTFPLPADAAVDDMTLRIGDRVVKGVIKRREEARKIYEEAKAQGKLAGLLDQERPNIFTQSVTNIPPGAKVQVAISYVQTLRYEAGSYEFNFPMVVGPRYMPGTPTGQQGGGWAPDTNRVPDASRISPKLAPPESRAGHDISLAVKLDAGVAIDSLRSVSHDVVTERPSPRQAVVKLKNEAEIPNKDFILRYHVAGEKVKDALLTHHDNHGGFFTLILMPPERVTAEDATPKELVFVLDTSGSMNGFPIQKAKETMRLAMAGLYPRDTFNLITFAGDTHVLFPHPVSATPENIRRAQEFLEGRRGSGGTEMMKAVRAALDGAGENGKVRIVCFMTDGYVGNDFEIIGEVQRHPQARVFSFGIGSSVNRFLLDKMASESRGEVEYVSLNEDGSAAARRFHERVRNPLLTDISLEWSGVTPLDVFPKRIPDLFGAEPVIVKGRYDRAGNGFVRLRGKMSGREVVREIPVHFAANEPDHDALATMWARARVEDLMSSDWQGLQTGRMNDELKEQIVKAGLDYRLMTQFTSFVAVEEKTVVEGGKPKTIQVPVEMPEGVSHEGVFGTGREYAAKGVSVTAASAMITAQGSAYGVVGGVMPSTSFGRADALREQRPMAAPPPPPPPPVKRSSPVKLDATLRAILAWHEGNGPKPAAVSSAQLRQGRVLVDIWLADATPAALAKLQQLGFQKSEKALTAKILTGWIPLAKLRELNSMTEVMQVTLHRPAE